MIHKAFRPLSLSLAALLAVTGLFPAAAVHAEPLPTASVVQTAVEQMYMKTTATALNVRTGPSSSNAVIGRIPYGTIIRVLSKESAAWYKISHSDQTGYVSASYLTAVTQSAVYLVTGSVNFRTGPSTAYSVIQKLTADTYVEVLAKTSVSWHKARAFGKTGYLSSRYIQPAAAPLPEPAPAPSPVPEPAPAPSPAPVPAPELSRETFSIRVKNADGTITTRSVTAEVNLAYAKKAFDLQNQHRANYGIKPLVWKESYYHAAKQRAAELSIKFAHDRPDGNLFYTVDTNLRLSGENVAYGQRTPESVFQDLKASPGHNENMLRSMFTTSGIGCVNINGTFYWALIYGTD